MKSILALTDFSENATHAAKSAVMLSEKLHTNLLFVHTFVSIPVTPDYMDDGFIAEETSWLVEESEENLRNFAESLDPVINQTRALSFSPEIHYQNLEGKLETVVDQIICQNNIELMVIGAKSGSFIDHILIGSDTKSVIDHATRPVLIIPPTTDLKKLQEVVFATDFSEMDILAIDYLVNLGILLNYQLTIIHVNIIGEKHLTGSAEEVGFIRRIKVKYPDVVYEEIRGRYVVERLNKLCEDTGVNLLALVHYQHSFITRMLLGSTTKHALSNQKVPLLVIPSNMDFKHQALNFIRPLNKRG